MVLLLHDTDLLRYPESARQEINLFNSVEALIVHTESMKKELEKQGVKSKQLILGLFDYYAKRTEVTKTFEDDFKSIVFAGNINKSLFLSHLQKIKMNIPFYLYGALCNSAIPACVSYEGSFPPDDIAKIKGGFGLVWDGDNLEGCATTDVGNYLRYNLSHKLSLYIACGKPVVVWKESSVAAWVCNNNLGYAVASLGEAIERINQCSFAEYQKMLQTVSVVQQKMIHGEFLKQVISQL